MDNILFEVFYYSNHHVLFLAIFPDVGMLQFQSVNYICQVCKLYFYFGHVRKSGAISIFEYFKETVKVFYFQLLLNIRCIAIVLTAGFFVFLEAKKPCFLMKNCSKSSYIFAFNLSKNSTINFRKTSLNNEWLVVENCPTPC